MSKQSITLHVPLSLAGTRLDAAVMELLADSEEGTLPSQVVTASRNRVRQWIEQGQLLVNDAVVKPATKTRGGETITLVVPEPVPTKLTPEAMDLEVLFEDSDLIVVNKKPDLVVHPGAGHATGTLVHGLLHHCKDLSGIGGELRPGIVHRLDRGTSGCMVVAKNDFVHEHLANQFAEREVHKNYLALVMGVPIRAKTKIATLHGRHPRERKKFSSKVKKGKEAVTRYEVLGSRDGISLVSIVLETGRTHQIRVHFTDMNHPLVGDPLYGGRQWSRIKSKEVRGLAQLLEHQALHAWKLVFKHPRTTEEIAVEASLPEPMASLLQLVPGLV
ncbi:MAG: RluA family pseudouridine synthase [Deltaproteobacteria bacterium]|jgi:23S rRNA pseudouridine1911/1915/1917 synthase|nr:RluA family pseudouridine synthase [Deltaproteobacteria bacterium]MBT6490165.1 RluA family pseudouridine synthase [Deltaproteobacteria bacterium]